MNTNLQEDQKIQMNYIEYNIVEHCNLRCYQCDHASPLLHKKFVDIEDFRADLYPLGKVIHVSELKIIGGEPLLHPEIHQLIEVARSTGISDKITLTTNGTLLHKMNRGLWAQIDRLQVTIYPGVKVRMDLKDLEVLSQEYSFELKVIHRNLFRYTLTDTPILDLALVQAIYDECELRTIHNCHTVRAGRYYKCSPAPFLADRLTVVGTDYLRSADDSVQIRDNPNLRLELLQYLSDKSPLPACQYCFGTSGHDFNQRQMKKEENNFSTEGSSLELLLNPQFLHSYDQRLNVSSTKQDGH